MTYSVMPRERLFANRKLSAPEQQNVWLIYCRYELVLSPVAMEDALDALMDAYVIGRDTRRQPAVRGA